MTRQRDKLFLLQPGFRDPAFPDQVFYCWHCALLEGVLASFPDLAHKLDIVRIAWPRPRAEIVALVGEAHQSIPLLILAEDAPPGSETGSQGEVRFVAGKDAILELLSRRHGFPAPHP